MAKLTSNVARLTAQYRAVDLDMKKAHSELNALMATAPAVSRKLINAYEDGNKAQDRISRDKVLLDNLNKKYIDYLNALKVKQR